MPIVIECIAGPGYDTTIPEVGQYLASYDPVGACAHPDHTQHVEPIWTADVAQAIHFPDARAAFATWTAVAICHPVRSDGKPNKPLTAVTVQIGDTDDDPS